MKLFRELQKLEERILDLKGKEREEAIETYRGLLSRLCDEPVYLMRYE